MFCFWNLKVWKHRISQPTRHIGNCTEKKQQNDNLFCYHFLRKQATVKPVYNGHPWDLKNVAVMQRVDWKRPVVGNRQAGRYGLNLAVVDRWPLFGGGR
jgi:hypothetical protein